MQYQGLTLDKFQVDSINSLENGHSVVVSAPTGSGKTLIADYLIDKKIKENKRVIYTAPIKALSNQKFKEFKKLFGEENIGLMTGDIVVNSQAPIVIMTTEIYRNMVLVGDEAVDNVYAVVFDEIHYINDIERGYVWEESIIFSKPKVRFLCLSATIPNAKEFALWIESIKKHKVDTILHDKRAVPLTHKFYDMDLGITDLDKIKDIKDIPDYTNVMKRRYRRGQKRPKLPTPSPVKLIRELGSQLPCLYFSFSRDDCVKKAKELADKNLFGSNPEITKYVREKLKDVPPDINKIRATKVLREILPRQIGFHHAGVLPILKELVEELFGKGLIKVLFTTETFAVGINMPAKTVCFDSLKKFDGISLRFLNSKEYFQMAGRAGRRGIDDQGLVVTMIFRQSFDYLKIKKITDKDMDPIQSQFRLSINTVLNLIKLHNKEEIDIILEQSFLAYQERKKNRHHIMKSRFENLKHRLIKLDYIKDDELTEKGDFGAKIYSDEILTTEIFGTRIVEDLSEHEILLILALLAYEPKEKDKFFKKNKNNLTKQIKAKLKEVDELKKDRRIRYIFEMAAMVEPCYKGADFFQVVENSNLLEGDIIRIFSQMLDRARQVRRASLDTELNLKLDSIADKIKDFLSDVTLY
tara:strand:+ start:2472 stop:4391 length:1920 start_codon:yes stop_codon:yes gene_type:complete